MARHTIYIAASENVGHARAHWCGELQSAWPGPEGVVFRCVGVDALIGQLEAAAATAAPAAVPAVLAVLGPGESTQTVDRLIESLCASHVPAVCLMQDPSPWRPFQHHGVIFDSPEVETQVLAGMLFALAERQSGVELLAREVILAQRCQGGIRTEMDRIHEELHLAASIQREFTSAPLPRVDGLEFGVLFRPVNFVSGDIYNVRPLGDGKAAFFLADAVGHGVPAALLTMVLTSSLTTTEHDGHSRRVLEPSEVLARLNTRLCESCLGSGRFATALYGVIDAHSGEVCVAGAGHPRPLVVSSSGAVELEAEGPLLGVFPEADFTQARARLQPGQTLLLYTDGFEAIFPSREPSAGESRWSGREYLGDLSRLVGAAEDGDLSSALRQIEHLLDEQSGSLHQSDDVTALAMTTVPQERLAAAPRPLSRAA